jgi:IPT/TIG domain
MSCARDINYQSANGTIPNTIVATRCRKYKPFLPSFAPTISSLSTTTSVYNQHAVIRINGSNFLPPAYGTTYVNFGNFTQLPIVFYSAFNISFVVPLRALAGNYNVQVVNIYNGNLSPSVNQSYAGIANYSNSITYTIT